MYSVTLSQETTETNPEYVMCYKFGSEPWARYDEYNLRVLRMSIDDYPEYYSSRKAIVDERKRFMITPLDNWEHTYIRFVKETDNCTAEGVLMRVYDENDRL